MRHVIAHLKKEKYLSFIYLAGFLLSLHYAFVVYINSSFLAQSFNATTIGILFTIGAIINIILLLNISLILQRFGNWRTMLFFLCLDIIALFILGTTSDPVMIGLAFILFQGVSSIIIFNLDIFLQTKLNNDIHVGGVWGIFLTMSNVAFVIAPYVVGTVIGKDNYKGAYFGSFCFAALVLCLIYLHFKKFNDPHYPHTRMRLALLHFIENRNLFHIYLTSFILQFFYTIMVIYTPFYLHKVMGFPWETIGEMFSIMLLPFVLVEVPGGRFADTSGEKKLLIFGLFLMALSTSMLPFLPANVVLWTFLLFATRCGAALVEIMTEAYFFKHVKGRDSNLIGFYRTTGPMAYIITPIIASLFLVEFNIKYIFILVALVLLYGIKYAYQIKDTV